MAQETKYTQSWDDFVKSMGYGTGSTGNILYNGGGELDADKVSGLGKIWSNNNNSIAPVRDSFSGLLNNPLGDNGVFSKGNLLGSGGAVNTAMGLGGTLLEGINMLDQHKMNKKASTAADLHNAGVMQMIGENNRQIALDKANKSKFDAGWGTV